MNENKELMDAVLGLEDDPILPDGWKEGDDLFAEVGGDVDAFVTDGSDELTDLPAENEDGNSAADDPTTVDRAGEADQSDEAEPKAETPDGESQPESKTSRILKLKVNHEEEELDIGAMSDEDLTALLQKGRAFDAMRESENKQKFRQIFQEQLDAGMTEAAAKLVAQNELGGKSYPLTDEAPPAETPAAPVKESSPTRDFTAEWTQLKTLHPDVKQIPDEVIAAYGKGIDLVTAYNAHLTRQNNKTAASLKRENEVLKQNAASAAKAPVRGVTGGGSTAPKKVDHFLAGFDSDEW